MAMIRGTNQHMEIHDQELVIVKADSVGSPRLRWKRQKNGHSYTAELDPSDIGKGLPILHAQRNR